MFIGNPFLGGIVVEENGDIRISFPWWMTPVDEITIAAMNQFVEMHHVYAKQILPAIDNNIKETTRILYGD